MVAKTGDTLPDVTLFENDFDHKVKIKDVFKGKKGVIFGVPGAFTPVCSSKHLPGYVKEYDNLKSQGVDVIVCTSVNDPYVMAAWGKDNNVGDKVRLLADPHGKLADGLGVTLQAAEQFGQNRSKRYSAFIDDNTVKIINVEEDGTGYANSGASDLVDQLKK